MPIVVIANPTAGSYDRFESVLGEATSRGDVSVIETSGEEDARKLSREHADAVDRLVVAGGDGTVNEVANGLYAAASSVPVALLPAGTGNDFARTLGVPLEPDDAASLAFGDSPKRRVDVLLVETDDSRSVALNAVNGGYAGDVVDDIDASTRQMLGPFAYLKFLPEAWRESEEHATHITWEEGSTETFEAAGLVAINGKSVGGGFEVVSDTHLSDGRFWVLVVHCDSILDVAELGSRLASGTLLESPHIRSRSVSGFSARTEPPMQFSVDGDPVTQKRLRIEVSPRVLEFVAPPTS